MRNGEMLSKALLIATNAHAGQFDRGWRPYILHPLAVMSILRSEDDELNTIAILHDVIEDSNVTFKDLADQGISDRVIEAVRALTKMPGQSYEEYKNAIFSNHDAMMVKSADLTHNSDIKRLKGIREKDIERISRYHRFYLEIQEKLRISKLGDN